MSFSFLSLEEETRSKILLLPVKDFLKASALDPGSAEAHYVVFFSEELKVLYNTQWLQHSDTKTMWHFQLLDDRYFLVFGHTLTIHLFLGLCH